MSEQERFKRFNTMESITPSSHGMKSGGSCRGELTEQGLEAIRALVKDERIGNAGRRAWAKRSHPEDEWRAMLDGAARTIDRLLDTLLSSLNMRG